MIVLSDSVWMIIALCFSYLFSDRRRSRQYRASKKAAEVWSKYKLHDGINLNLVVSLCYWGVKYTILRRPSNISWHCLGNKSCCRKERSNNVKKEASKRRQSTTHFSTIFTATNRRWRKRCSNLYWSPCWLTFLVLNKYTCEYLSFDRTCYVIVLVYFLFQPNRPKIKSLYQSFEKSSEQGMKPRCYNVYCGVVYMPAVVAVHSLKYVHAVGWCHVRSQETSPRRWPAWVWTSWTPEKRQHCLRYWTQRQWRFTTKGIFKNRQNSTCDDGER